MLKDVVRNTFPFDAEVHIYPHIMETSRATLFISCIYPHIIQISCTHRIVACTMGLFPKLETICLTKYVLSVCLWIWLKCHLLMSSGHLRSASSSYSLIYKLGLQQTAQVWNIGVDKRRDLQSISDQLLEGIVYTLTCYCVGCHWVLDTK